MQSISIIANQTDIPVRSIKKEFYCIFWHKYYRSNNANMPNSNVQILWLQIIAIS